MTISNGEPYVNGDAEAAEATLPLDDGNIYVCQDGPRDAPALLLIHGSASSTTSWDELVPMLTKSHRVIRVDLLGHGRSAKPADRSYGVPEQAHRVGEVLDRLGVKHSIVVGHSSGGIVATALAEQRPDLVSALALINTGPSMDAFIAPESAAGPSQSPPTDEQLRQLVSSGFSTGYQIPQALVDELRGMDYHAVTAAMQGARDYLEQRALPDRLTPLGKPLLVIFGAEDRRWRSSSAADYRVVPGAIVELLPGVGHTPILEDPPQTAASLLAFTAVHAAQAD
jgi:pimeloyl-ACP methyl ester carboxylesterase